MVLFNYAIREITAKIVYYGPGLGGKTTNLQHIHEKLDPSSRGKLLSLATDGDRTLFFDFLPIEMGNIGGYKVRFQLYTVPGQVHYNATRKLVLKGVDAVAFVADSQVTMFERNRESYENLIENLVDNGYDPAKVPVLIQLNKRDLPNIGSVPDLVASMGVQGLPVREAVASRGDGVFETLKDIVKLTLAGLRTQFESDGSSSPSPGPEAPPPPPPRAVFGKPEAPAPPAAEAPAAEAPPAAEAEPEAPPESGPGLEEFDLEDFAERPEAVAEVTAGGAAGAAPEAEAAEEVLELEPAHEVEVPAEPGMDEEEAEAARRAFFDEFAGLGDGEPEAPEPPAEAEPEPEPEPPVSVAAPPPAVEAAPEPPAGAMPPWGEELAAEVRLLREENRALREALGELAAALGRQIESLGESRAALERAAAPRRAGGEG